MSLYRVGPSDDPAMSDPIPLTRDALESLLAEASHETVVSFVADLLEREGRDVRRDGSVIAASRPRGGQERFLVRTDDRGRIGRLIGTDPAVSDRDPVDAVVTPTRDGDGAAAVAEAHDARVVDAAELHDRLLYAIDRGSCLELCRKHFDAAVEPRPTSGARRERSAIAAALQPRMVLATVALLGAVVAIAVGLPAVSGGAGLDPGGPAAAPTVDGAEPVTPVGGEAPTEAERATPTATPTPTSTPEQYSVVRCEDCLPLYSVPDLRVEAGSEKTVTSTLHNPNPYDVVGIETRLGHSSSAIGVEPSRGVRVGALEPNESRELTWQLSAADSAAGTYEIFVVIRFAGENRTTYGKGSVPVTVTEPTTTIPGDCEEPCEVLASDGTVRAPAGGTTAVTATVRNPYDATLTDVEVIAEPHGDDWIVSPANGTALDAVPPGASRELRWNLTVPTSAAGEYSFVVRATFSGPEGEANRTVETDYSVYVVPPDAESTTRRTGENSPTMR
jgi:hypothetical protein